MAVNMALKRAQKAQRRKQIVASKREAQAMEMSPLSRVSRAAEAPIQLCVLTDSLLEGGIGALIVGRGHSSNHLALGTFLLDAHCLGIKDVMFRPVGGAELEMYLETMGAAAPLVPVDPSYARKLLRDLAAWAQSLGFPPHRDFAVVERIFGDVSADTCDVAFRFGVDGKPVYSPGPTESPSLVRRRIEQLRATLGDDGFNYVGLALA